MRPPSLMPWLGGKHLMAETIISLMPDHRLYCEHFLGTASVFLRKPLAHHQILNDVNGDLINLWRVVQSDLPSLCQRLEWLLHSRETFEQQIRLNPADLEPVEQAARYYYCVRCAFSGGFESKVFGTAKDKKSPFQYEILRADLRRIHVKLQPATIERMDALDCAERYDSEGTLHYFDPPYVARLGGYGVPYTLDDLRAIAGFMSVCDGDVIVSIDDTPESRDIFQDYHITSKQIPWSVGSGQNGGAKYATELVVTSYDTARIMPRLL